MSTSASASTSGTAAAVELDHVACPPKFSAVPPITPDQLELMPKFYEGVHPIQVIGGLIASLEKMCYSVDFTGWLRYNGSWVYVECVGGSVTVHTFLVPTNTDEVGLVLEPCLEDLPDQTLTAEFVEERGIVRATFDGHNVTPAVDDPTTGCGEDNFYGPFTLLFHILAATGRFNLQNLPWFADLFYTKYGAMGVSSFFDEAHFLTMKTVDSSHTAQYANKPEAILALLETLTTTYRFLEGVDDVECAHDSDHDLIDTRIRAFEAVKLAYLRAGMKRAAEDSSDEDASELKDGERPTKRARFSKEGE